MFVDTTTDPPPSVRSRVLRVGHVRAGIEAPRGAGFASDFPPGAEKGPDVVGTVRISRVVLLWRVQYAIPTGNASLDSGREDSLLYRWNL